MDQTAATRFFFFFLFSVVSGPAIGLVLPPPLREVMPQGQITCSGRCCTWFALDAFLRWGSDLFADAKMPRVRRRTEITWDFILCAVCGVGV